MNRVDRPVHYPLTVFYDASCPMCATEMNALKARDREGRLELVDCSAPQFDEDALLGDGLRRRDLMELIHARDAHGRWFVGTEVFELAYAAAGPRRLYPWVTRHHQVLSRLGFNRVMRLLLATTAR
jgi:predicted DCC family thiol-disulfide oxidoreductase YuxK